MVARNFRRKRRMRLCCSVRALFETIDFHRSPRYNKTMKVYLDYAATAPLDGEILDKMLPYLKANFGNSDSLHSFGRETAYAVSEARERVAGALGVRAKEVYFTAGGTEADNWAVRVLGEGSVLTSPVEHRAVLDTVRAARKHTVCAVGRDGLVSAQNVADALAPDTGLVCVMAVNNETGSIQPLEEISALCRERGALLFSDCVQAGGALDMKRIAKSCDAFSLSAHKIYGPKGVGALVVKSGVKLRPMVLGGEQERGLRGGTTNVAGVVGFSYALEKAQAEREENQRKIKKVRDFFEERILSALQDGVRVDGLNRVANISHITLKEGNGALLNKLDLYGVACSGGAACSAHSPLPSHVMLAMGRTEEEARRGLRFSCGRETTEEEAAFAADVLIKCVRE